MGKCCTVDGGDIKILMRDQVRILILIRLKHKRDNHPSPTPSNQLHPDNPRFTFVAFRHALPATR
jgi:hypothetical protein